MSCLAFLARVDELVAGSLVLSEHEELARHLDECAACREILAALSAPRPDTDDADHAADAQLSERILARTSGAACGSATSRLCAWIDGELEAVDADLVAGHVRHCGECAGLARTLELLRSELPRLAVDPGPGFLEGVLAHTSRRARREPLGARLSARIAELFARPRIALEGAFVATAMLVVPVLVPGSPFRDVPDRALEIVSEPPTLPRELAGRVRGTIGRLESTLALRAGGAWETAHAFVVEDASEAAAGVGRNAVSTWKTIRRHFGTSSDPAASRQEGAGKAKTTGTQKPPRRT